MTHRANTDAAHFIADKIVDGAPFAHAEPAVWSAWRNRVRDVIADIARDGVEHVASVQGWCPRCGGTEEVKVCAHGTDNCPCAYRACEECAGGVQHG